MPDRAPAQCKLCDLPDFADPELAELIRDVFASDAERFGGRRFPEGREYRKYWEIAMALRAFRSHGIFRDDAEVLGVGAGHEATIYWLTRHVGRVVATDRYRMDDSWSETDTGADMISDPGRYWEGPWEPDRLEVRDMDAHRLEFPDASFDAVFSSSSLEHFGDFAEIRRAVEEIHRVLRPGGVAALSTEFRLDGPSMDFWPGIKMFDEAELRSLLLDGLWWDPADPLDTRISDAALASAVDYQEALADQEAGREGWSSYPHVVLRDRGFRWTSVHLALVRGRGSAAEWRRRTAELPPPERRLRKRLGLWRAKAGQALERG